jgi:NAD(P)H-dependent flavin oxidoreductase YrpB (nitropropane dioxygenase family)
MVGLPRRQGRRHATGADFVIDGGYTAGGNAGI